MRKWAGKHDVAVFHTQWLWCWWFNSLTVSHPPWIVCRSYATATTGNHWVWVSWPKSPKAAKQSNHWALVLHIMNCYELWWTARSIGQTRQKARTVHGTRNLTYPERILINSTTNLRIGNARSSSPSPKVLLHGSPIIGLLATLPAWFTRTNSIDKFLTENQFIWRKHSLQQPSAVQRWGSQQFVLHPPRSSALPLVQEPGDGSQTSLGSGDAQIPLENSGMGSNWRKKTTQARTKTYSTMSVLTKSPFATRKPVCNAPNLIQAKGIACSRRPRSSTGGDARGISCSCWAVWGAAGAGCGLVAGLVAGMANGLARQRGQDFWCPMTSPSPKRQSPARWLLKTGQPWILQDPMNL